MHSVYYIMKSTKVQNSQRNKCSTELEMNCLVAEYRILYRIGPSTIITHAHCAALIDGLGHAMWSVTGLVPITHRLASCVIMSGFRAALGLDTYSLSNLNSSTMR